jgi:hypothetical protein
MSKAIHFTRSTGAAASYPICSAGSGKGIRRNRPLATALIANVTCKTCLKMLACDGSRVSPPLPKYLIGEERAAYLMSLAYAETLE